MQGQTTGLLFKHKELGLFGVKLVVAIPESTSTTKDNMIPTTSPKTTYESGDKVFVISEQRLATVLDIYGDGLNGDFNDIRLDLSGNASLDNIEKYDAQKHAAFDNTFLPIKSAWKELYNITKDVPLRSE
jgi:hypothetical protein